MNSLSLSITSLVPFFFFRISFISSNLVWISLNSLPVVFCNCVYSYITPEHDPLTCSILINSLTYRIFLSNCPFLIFIDKSYRMCTGSTLGKIELAEVNNIRIFVRTTILPWNILKYMQIILLRNRGKTSISPLSRN